MNRLEVGPIRPGGIRGEDVPDLVQGHLLLRGGLRRRGVLRCLGLLLLDRQLVERRHPQLVVLAHRLEGGGGDGPFTGPTGGGSDDIGDVSWNVPTVTLRYPSNIPGGPGHNWANAIAMATPIAHKGVIAGAKVQAQKRF